MDIKIKENIERLGEICGVASMIKLGEDIINEQKTIINYLTGMNVIIIGNDGKGFLFTNDEYKVVFLNSMNNF